MSTNEQWVSQISARKPTPMTTGTMCIADTYTGTSEGTSVSRTVNVEGT